MGSSARLWRQTHQRVLLSEACEACSVWPNVYIKNEFHSLYATWSRISSMTEGSSGSPRKNMRSRRPCKEMVLYFHDIIYNGKNSKNATSAIVGAPAWGNHTILTKDNHFGNLVVFDDPITLDNNLHSPPVGRAQGFYIYDQKDIFTAWLGFSFVFNSTAHKGTITFAGADPLMNKTRDISVIGGTGDFFMTRGIATIMTDSFEGEVYFRLRVDIKFYECW